MKNIVIMGAGPAGLTAGIELQLKYQDIQVTIIDRTETVGGISRTVEYQGNKLDIGGHRYFSMNEAVLQWWDSILPIQPSSSSTPANNNSAYMMVRPRSSHIYFNGQFIHYPLKIDRYLLKAVGPLRSVKILLSYAHAQLSKRDVQSLEDYYINQFGHELYSIFFKGYTQKVCGVTPDLISPDWGTQRVKGLSISELFKSIFDQHWHQNTAVAATMTDTFLFPPGGSGQLWETAAKKFLQAGGKILFNCTPTKIRAAKKHIIGIECQQSGLSLHLPADVLISTIPLTQLFTLLPYAPPAPILSAVTDLHYRDFILVGLLIDKRKLTSLTEPESLLIQDSWVYIQNEELRMSRIQIFNNWSPYMVKDSTNFILLGVEFCCSKDDDWWQSDDETIVEQCLFELKQLNLFSGATIDTTYVIREEKAYPCYHGAYRHLDSLHSYLRDSFDNLYCLGRNGEHRYLNIDQLMEHAFDLVHDISGVPDAITTYQ